MGNDQMTATKIIKVSMDTELLGRIDRRVKQLGSTRSAFASVALRAALDRSEDTESEERHRAGYRNIPSTHREFSVPDKDLAWGDDAWSD